MELTQPKPLEDWAVLLKGKTRKEVIALLGKPYSSFLEDGYLFTYKGLAYNPILETDEKLNLLFDPSNERLIRISPRNKTWPISEMKLVEDLIPTP